MASRVPLLSVPLLALFAACSAAPARPPSGADLAVGDGNGDDAGAPPDTGVPGGGDDLGPPPDLETAPGLSWPAGQQFPSFASIGPLDVIDLTALAADRQTLAVTLEGLVNRQRPRIYCEDGGGEGKTFWLDRIDTPKTTVTDPLALVAKYRAEIAGIVVYDSAQADTLNLATVIAGQNGGVVASPALAPTLMAAPYSLPLIADLRTNHFASNVDVYQYELDHWSANATHRLIVGLNPGIAANLRDYAVATKAMMVWLDPRNATEATLLSKFLALLPPSSPYLGWWVDEPTGVHAASTQGVPTFAADWSSNLTVLGGTPRGSAPTPPRPAPPPLENKIYVAIIMSDGDNVQEDQHLVPIKWADAHRGQVPIGWTIDPALVDVAPVILRYFQSTATPADVLVSGPSGLGYTYPAAWNATDFDGFTKITSGYMSAAKLDVITVWNNGVDLSAQNGHSYVANLPGLAGLTIQDESQPQQFLDGTLPLVKLATSYAANEAALESGIDAQLSGWSGAAPLFIAVQGDMNQGVITPTAFYNVQQHYATNANVVFVRADHLFRLLRVAQAPPAHRVFSGDFTGDGKSDALFYYGGDGNWWLGVSDGTTLTWHLAGNVAGLGDGKHAFYTGDFNGDGKLDVLVYGSADGSWRLGASDGTNLTFTTISTNAGFGDLLDGAHRTFVGDFNGDGKSDVLFYYKGDGALWLGTSSGTALGWTKAGDASGFGNLLDGSHALWTGDFNGDGKSDLVFYYNGDGSIWLGACDGATVTFHQSANGTSGFGNLVDPSRRIVQGDFNGDGKSDLAFYYNGDGHVWIGLSDGTNLAWHVAGTVATTSNLADASHRLYVGDFDGDKKSDLAYYDSDDGSFWIGASDGTNLAWHQAASAPALGNLVELDHLLFGGDFNGDGKSDFLSYASDGSWRIAASDGAQLSFHAAGTTSGFGDLTR